MFIVQSYVWYTRYAAYLTEKKCILKMRMGWRLNDLISFLVFLRFCFGRSSWWRWWFGFNGILNRFGCITIGNGTLLFFLHFTRETKLVHTTLVHLIDPSLVQKDEENNVCNRAKERELVNISKWKSFFETKKKSIKQNVIRHNLLPSLKQPNRYMVGILITWNRKIDCKSF